jgi:hypothetical protein
MLSISACFASWFKRWVIVVNYCTGMDFQCAREHASCPNRKHDAAQSPIESSPPGKPVGKNCVMIIPLCLQRRHPVTKSTKWRGMYAIEHIPRRVARANASLSTRQPKDRSDASPQVRHG